MALTEGQYELEGVVFGRHTTILVGPGTELMPDPEIATNDMPVAYGDGVQFGQDWLSGLEPTFDIIINTREPGLDKGLEYLAALRTAWRADHIRTTPGAVTQLDYMKGGRLRTIFGRGRKFKANTAMAATRGWIPATATFKMADDNYYGSEQTNTVRLAPPFVLGLQAPLVPPLTLGGNSQSPPGVIHTGGTVRTWPVVTITAPNGITNPIVDLVLGWSFELRTTLEPGQSVTIDPRPWKNTVLRSDGANLAGKATASSPRLSQLWLEPGERELVLRGIDPSGTATMTIAWRPAFPSP